MCPIGADFKHFLQTKTFGECVRSAQGLVDHASQGVVNHAASFDPRSRLLNQPLGAQTDIAVARSHASTGNIIPAGSESREASEHLEARSIRRVKLHTYAARHLLLYPSASARMTSERMAARARSSFIANASCCVAPCTACAWPSTFASTISSASRCASRRYQDAGARSSRPVADGAALRQHRRGRDRDRLADVERDFRASAASGQRPRASTAAPAPQRDPRTAAEIPGASPPWRPAQRHERPRGEREIIARNLN